MSPITAVLMRRAFPHPSNGCWILGLPALHATFVARLFECFAGNPAISVVFGNILMVRYERTRSP